MMMMMMMINATYQYAPSETRYWVPYRATVLTSRRAFDCESCHPVRLLITMQLSTWVVQLVLGSSAHSAAARCLWHAECLCSSLTKPRRSPSRAGNGI